VEIVEMDLDDDYDDYDEIMACESIFKVSQAR
jgi:hypothetical protein